MTKHLAAAAISAVCATCALAADPVDLFNGKDLAGWTAFSSKPGVKLEDVWSVRDGIIVCKGEPMGWLATEKKFTDYKLTAEWRWAPGQKPGNSGLFQRINGEPSPLPRCFEVQLKSGTAGDLMGFHGMAISGDPARAMKARTNEMCGALSGVNKIEANEKTPGEWNQAEVVVKGDTLTVTVNGKKVNEATGCTAVAGAIGLQSEGGEVHFRNVRVTPLD